MLYLGHRSFKIPHRNIEQQINARESGNMQKQRQKMGTVKIIGGKWKTRKVLFRDSPGLRPTLARTRETLFNWLRPYILDSHCLDLFAGSGALGFEALSQGASFLTCVDNNLTSINDITKQAALFETGITAVHGDSVAFLRGTSEAFDIIFIDPPYSQEKLFDDVLSIITKKNLAGKFLYIETSDIRYLNEIENKFPLKIHRTSKSGQSHFSIVIPKI